MMMNTVRSLILCNNPVAIPGIKEFLFYGNVAAVATTARNKEMQHILRQLTEGTGVPLLTLNKREYKSQLADAIQELEVHVVLMMTFPYIIPAELLQLPVKGFINFHYGLLPGCGGPQPILRHMLNNDQEAGVTVHQVDAGVDTGPVIMQERIPIAADDTYGTLQGKLAFLAAKLAANLFKVLSYGTLVPSVPQDKTAAKYFEMPAAAELTINWQQMNAQEIIRLVNACNPWNKGAGATIGNWFIGITEALLLEGQADSGVPPGTVLACDENSGLVVKTSDDKKLKITIVYTQEGFFSGSRMAAFGIQAGMQFN